MGSGASEGGGSDAESAESANGSGEVVSGVAEVVRCWDGGCESMGWDIQVSL